MTLSEVKELLEHLENEISKYEFDIDKNFTMNSKKNDKQLSIKEK